MKTKELDKLEFLTVRQVADICHFKGTEPVKRAIKRKELPAVNLSHWQILVPKAALTKWLLAHGMGSLEGKPNAGTLLAPTKAPKRALKAIADRKEQLRKKTRQIDDEVV